MIKLTIHLKGGHVAMLRHVTALEFEEEAENEGKVRRADGQ